MNICVSAAEVRTAVFMPEIGVAWTRNDSIVSSVQ